MSDSMGNRIAGIGGILWIVLVLVGFGAIVGFSPLITDSKAEVADYFAGANWRRVYLGEYLEVLGFLLFVIFVARLRAILRAAEGSSDWLATLAFGGALVHVALSLAGIAPLIALSYRADHGSLGEDLYVALNDTRVALYWMSLLVAPVFLLPLGLLIARTDVFPRWLGWLAIGLGVALLIGLLLPTSGIPDVASMLMLLWALVVGVLLVVRADRYAGEGGRAESPPIPSTRASINSDPGRPHGRG